MPDDLVFHENMAIERIHGAQPPQPSGPRPEEVIAAKKLKHPLGEFVQTLQRLSPEDARDAEKLAKIRDQVLALYGAAKKATEL